MRKYDVMSIHAIAECAGDTEYQDSVLVHEIADRFHDGDCILFGYSPEDFRDDADVLNALQNESPISDFTVDECGIYHA